MKIHGTNQYEALRQSLTLHCEACCGLCCTALYFSKTEGFPADKKPGVPCKNLKEDFRCSIHTQLTDLGLKGCAAFDCIGAGQKVTQAIYNGETWRSQPQSADEMYNVFLRVWRLHQILWYLTESVCLLPAAPLYQEISALIEKNNTLTAGSAADILCLNIDALQVETNVILKKAADLTQAAAFEMSSHKKTKARAPRSPFDYMGKDLRGEKLNGQDFSAMFLIAANLEGCQLYGTNFLGADLRDSNLNDADMSESIFLTQTQLNSAKGNACTKLPPTLQRPFTWALS